MQGYQIVTNNCYPIDSVPNDNVTLDIGPGVYSKESVIVVSFYGAVSTYEAQQVLSRKEFCQGSVGCEVFLDGKSILVCQDLRAIQLLYFQTYMKQCGGEFYNRDIRQLWERCGRGDAGEFFQAFKLFHFIPQLFREKALVVNNRLVIKIKNNGSFVDYCVQQRQVTAITNVDPEASATFNVDGYSAMFSPITTLSYKAMLRRMDVPIRNFPTGIVRQEVYKNVHSIYHSLRLGAYQIAIFFQNPDNVGCEYYDVLEGSGDETYLDLNLTISYKNANILNTTNVLEAKQQIKFLKDDDNNVSNVLGFYINEPGLIGSDAVQINFDAAYNLNVFITEFA